MASSIVFSSQKRYFARKARSTFSTHFISIAEALDQADDLAGERGNVLVGSALAALGKFKQRLRRRDKLGIQIVGTGLLHRALALGNIALADHFVRGKVVALGELGRVCPEAECIQLFGEHRRHILVAMDDKHVRRLRVKGLDPLDQMIVVGMGRKALEVDDFRLDGDLLAKELDLLHAVEQPAAQCAGRLEADEYDRAVRTPEVVLQMVADAARVAHTGGGDDDLGRGVHVEHLGFLARLDQIEIREGEHMRAVLDKLERLLVEISVQIAAEDGRQKSLIFARSDSKTSKKVLKKLMIVLFHI